MANNRFPYTAALKTFQDTDDTWSAELSRVFGKEAGQARYEPRGKGQPGSLLRQLHATRERARIAWHATAA